MRSCKALLNTSDASLQNIVESDLTSSDLSNYHSGVIVRLVQVMNYCKNKVDQYIYYNLDNQLIIKIMNY